MLFVEIFSPKVMQIQFREYKHTCSWSNEFPTALEIKRYDSSKRESRGWKRIDVLMNRNDGASSRRLLLFQLPVFTVAQGRANLPLDGGQWRTNEKIRYARDTRAILHARGKEIGSCWMGRGCKIAIARGICMFSWSLKCGGTGLIGRRGTTLPSIHTTIPVSCYSMF